MEKYKLTVTNAETGEAVEGAAGRMNCIETELALFCALGGADENGSAWLNGIVADGEFDENTVRGLVSAVFANLGHLCGDNPEQENEVIASVAASAITFIRDRIGREKAREFILYAALAIPEG